MKYGGAVIYDAYRVYRMYGNAGFYEEKDKVFSNVVEFYGDLSKLWFT